MRHLAGLLPGLLPSALFARTPSANERLAPKPRGRTVRMLASDGTFNAGRNEEKREARADEAAFRAAVVAGNRGKRSPKRRISSRMIEMLSDRRLRQTRGGL
jgi:hypothetical protein